MGFELGVGNQVIAFGFGGEDDVREPEAVVKDNAFGSKGEVVEMFDAKAMGAEDNAIDEPTAR